MNKEKTKINAEVVADSIDIRGNRLTSLLITFPRIILSEINTHRMLVKNTSSSRAIPFNKMVEAIKEDPFIPVAWQKHHSGMQGSEYLTKDNFEEFVNLENNWLISRDQAVASASVLNKMGVTKQLCNRLLEPFMWTTMLITGSKEGWDNFFSLRCPQYEWTDYEDENIKSYYKSKKKWSGQQDSYDTYKPTEIEWLKLNKGQAEIHMMALAEAIYDSMNESKPEELSAGEYHIPFKKYLQKKGLSLPVMLKCSVAMTARTSYTVFEDSVGFSEEKLVNLYERLTEQDPPHSSPFEHVGRAMSDYEYDTFLKGKITDRRGVYDFQNPRDYTREESIKNRKKVGGWCYSLRGFVSYRYMLENNLL